MHDYNLNTATLQTRRDIRLSERFCVTATDRNLRPGILEMDEYIERAHSDHLGNTSQYTEISARAAAELDLANYQQSLKLTVDDRRMDKESIEYFTKKLCGTRSDNGVIQMPEHLRLPYFYLLPKIHNTLEDTTCGRRSLDRQQTLEQMDQHPTTTGYPLLPSLP
jgi:hypothetical protein